MHVLSIFIAPQLDLNIWEHFDVVFEWICGNTVSLHKVVVFLSALILYESFRVSPVKPAAEHLLKNLLLPQKKMN